MRGLVKKVSNFTRATDWLFVIEDENRSEYFIMTSDFYRNIKLKTPVTKKELDSLDTNMWITFQYVVIGTKNLVTKIVSWGCAVPPPRENDI